MAPERLGKYEVLRKIASGGMSEVWLCRLRGEEGFEKKVAVKVVHPRLSGDPRFHDLFAREARIAASLSHQNLVQVFDFGRHGESCFLAMEYVAGWNLAHATAQARLRAVPVPLPVWRYWLEGILTGIGYLHSRGIVHRDVSPSNILLSRGGAVKVADFGIARRPGAAKSGAATREGKFSYMSPEQARGADATFSSDLFAAAVVAAELLLPRRLFDGESPSRIMERLRDFEPERLSEGTFPPEVDGLLRKALAGRPGGRYPDADAFAEALRAAVPLSAGRGGLSAYWDILFPASETGDEATVVVDPPSGSARPVVVRESRGEYGPLGTVRGKIGAAAALVAISVGGAMVWHGARTGEREGAPAASQSRPSDMRASPSAGNLAVSGSPRTDIGPKGTGEARARDAVGTGGGGTVRASGSPEPHGAPGPGAAPVRFGGPVGNAPRAAGEVSFETDPPGVAVSVDDEIPLGRTPLCVDVAPWKGRTITFQKEGYVKRAIRSESFSGLADFRMEMERQTGTVEMVQAIPWAKVYDGERYLGDTPFGPLTLATGEHRLRFVNEPLGIEKEEEVVISPGRNPKIIVHLIRK